MNTETKTELDRSLRSLIEQCLANGIPVDEIEARLDYHKNGIPYYADDLQRRINDADDDIQEDSVTVVE